MMNNSTKNQACNLASGSIITGKWHKNSYQIMKTLGQGATGIVYLAKSNDTLVAVKVSDNSMSITSEVNVLKHFSKVQGSSLGPSLLDVDDWISNKSMKPVPFYVMEYIEGQNLLSFIKNRGHEWTGIICLKLLSDLERIHRAGWVFGDLKPDNLIVSASPPSIRIIDVGGTTIQGRAIKEYTEFFDRGYWGMGSRKAEPSYDLFAVAMIIINTAYPSRFSKTNDSFDQLKKVIRSNQHLTKYEKVLLYALTGKYNAASEMRNHLIEAINNTKDVKPSNQGAAVTKRTRVNNRTPKRPIVANQVKKRSKKSGLIETILIVAFMLMAYILYIYGQLL